MAENAPLVFLDFDGTIARTDVVDTILERHAAPGWLDLEAEWAAGRLGSRQCLRLQLALVRASVAEIDALLAEVRIDEGFADLLEVCAGHSLQTHIVSDGFDYCIARILARAPARVRRLLAHVGVHASHLEAADGTRWHTGFPLYPDGCAHGCATCKPAVMRTLNSAAAPTVFVGDGLSDRHAGADADVVFAKSSLATYCAGHGIAHVGFDHLGEVAAVIDARMRQAGRWRRVVPAAAGV